MMELKKLIHFFNKRIYVVPEYQRGYSWQPENIFDLLTDIDHSIKLESSHYTGTITIHPQNESEKIGLNSYDIYHLVDGQQRITSLIIILSYLIKAISKNPELASEAEEKEKTYVKNKGSYLFRYGVDKVSELYFRSLILENESLSSLDENLYTRNLLKAKDAVKSFFIRSENSGREVEFLNAIEEKLLFNEYIVSDTSEIGVVFETMNNRGIPLSNLEIVKNRLLYLTSKVKISEENQSRLGTISQEINQKWAIILRNLTLPTSVLDEDTFLNNHWVIYNGWAKDNQARDEILNSHFSIKRMVDDPSSMSKKIKNYISSLATTSLHWRFINYPEEDKAFMEVEDKKLREKIKLVFMKLNRLSNSTVRPMLLAFLPLMKQSPEFLLELAELAEIFSFRLFSMNKRRSDTGKNDIFRSCREFHANHKVKETQQKALYYLAWYIDEYGDKNRFISEIQELFNSSKKEGYYSWRGLIYFLYEYEEALVRNENRKVDYSFAKQKSHSIEHILPQNYKANQSWRELFPDLINRDEKELLHSLGNLVLISSSKNSSLKDSFFSVKKEAFKKGSFSEIEIGNNNRIWSQNKIIQREKSLLKFLDERWRIGDIMLKLYPNPDESEINDIEVEQED